MTDDRPTAPLGGAPREAEREIWEDAWDVLNAAHLTLFEYAYERDEATFEKLRAQIAEGRRQVADVLGVRIEELESQLAAATARVRELEGALLESGEHDAELRDGDWKVIEAVCGMGCTVIAPRIIVTLPDGSQHDARYDELRALLRIRSTATRARTALRQEEPRE